MAGTGDTRRGHGEARELDEVEIQKDFLMARTLERSFWLTDGKNARKTHRSLLCKSGR